MEHHWLSTALIIYCSACYTFAFYWMRNPCHEGLELFTHFESFRRQRPIRGWVAMAVTVVFLSPVIVPYAVFVCLREYRKVSIRHRQLVRTHRPFAFIWLNPAKLPAEASDYIDVHSHEMLIEGFRVVGTYIMKTVVPGYYGRVFIDDSGTTVSVMCHLNGENFFSFTSAFESGRVLETTPTALSEGLRPFVENPRMTAHFATGATIAEAYRRHLDKAGEIYAETGDRPLAFTSDQACDVLEYEARVFSAELFTLGRLDALPPKPELPIGQAMNSAPLPT